MHGDMRYGNMHGVAYNILVFRRPVVLLLLVCVLHARHATYLCGFFLFVVISFACYGVVVLPMRAGLHYLVVYLWYISTVVRFVTYLFSLCLPLTALCLFRWFLALRGI